VYAIAVTEEKWAGKGETGIKDSCCISGFPENCDLWHAISSYRQFDRIGLSRFLIDYHKRIKMVSGKLLLCVKEFYAVYGSIRCKIDIQVLTYLNGVDLLRFLSEADISDVVFGIVSKLHGLVLRKIG
jgi:hypothetical protein